MDERSLADTSYALFSASMLRRMLHDESTAMFDPKVPCKKMITYPIYEHTTRLPLYLI